MTFVEPSKEGELDMADTNVFDELESIAIIGMSGRFPEADSVDELWQNLCDGVETITFFSDEELLEAGVDRYTLSQSNYVKAHPMLRNVEMFDAAFFDIPPREAEIIDPQKRLFLECCWEALEDAGYDSETYGGWVGVYGGVGTNGYYESNLRSNADLLASTVGSMMPVVLGNEHDYLTTRVSYKLDLKGPSFNLQCACSTSLVAVHLACLSLLNYRCDMALAGGVTVEIPQVKGYEYDEGSLVSPDGHCRPFDAKAQGTVFGSGVGVVTLKRASEAIRDGDHIYAIIKGTAVSNDGAAKVGFTAPGVDGQKRVLSMAQQVAEVHPEAISYIETHGTGTSLGDPIEIEALTQVFRAHTDKKQFCAIGSIKGNVGHLDRAAGVTGLIKTALALKRKKLPPSINFEAPNPRIDFTNSPFYVNTELREWEASGGQPRLAGVSAFGVGGTNAHAILEEAPEVESSGESRRYQLLALSARTDVALENMTDNLVAHFQANPELKLADTVHTLHVGRRAFERRRVLVCETPEDAVAALRDRDPTRVLTGTQIAPDAPVVFMFSGQGAQYVNMGRDLYEREPLFREQVNTCAEVLRSHLEIDLRDVLYPDDAVAEWAAEQLQQTRLTQPALFVIEYALARLWMAWGVEPTAMIGHSIGEYTAACLAGVFDLEDALALVAARGRLMQSMPPGSMLSVPLAEADIQPLLSGALTVATINGPQRCAVSGPTEEIADLEQRLTDEGVTIRQLHTSHAFHSSMMDPILKPFEEQVRQVRLHEPQIPYISNVTGTWITAEEATDPVYWAQHLRRAVRFSDGVGVLAQSPEQVLLEVGPGRTLRTLAQRHPDHAPEQPIFSSMRHPRDEEDDDAFLLRTLGQLWLTGVTVDWPAFYQNEQRLRLRLPTYPFDRRRYWIEIRRDAPDVERRGHMSKTPDIADWFYIPSWKHTMPPVQEAGEREGHCLLFGDGDGFSGALAQRLRTRGYTVTTVLAGEQFAAKDNTFTIHPARREDYDALFEALGERAQSPTHILHLWNLAPVDESVSDFTEKALQRSFYGPLFLAQAIGAQGIEDAPALAVISSRVQRVIGEEPIDPEKAASLGLCQVIRQEMPGVAARSIDVELPAAGSAQESRLVEQIVAEVEVDAPDPIIAYRGLDRLVRTYEPVSLAELGEGENPTLRDEGVYLITGGLGGIGLTLAEYLAQTVHARLVLTSRSHFPEADAWEQWLATHDSQDRTSLRIQTVQALREMGAEVMVVQADVADRSQMEAAIRAACEQFGTIHGVIHAAGLAGGGVIQLKTEEAADRVLRPKVHGTRVLEAVLQDIPLDFLVLCSSVTSTMGDIGQVDYCAANAFMDAFAHASNGHNGGATISINWDAWAEVGMAVNTATDYSGVRGQPTFEMIPVDFPLFTSFYRETDKRTVYQMELSPDKDWVLSEHVIMGISAIPGTTYLELARAAFENCTQSDQVEISDVMFFTPLMVGEGDSKEAQLILDERADGFDFQVRSKAGVTASGEAQWQVHVMGRLGTIADDEARQHDLDAIRARCSLEIEITEQELDDFMSSDGDEWLTYGPRWHSPRHANLGQGEVLVSLELGQEFLPDLEDLKLHPALLDVATGFAMAILPGVNQRYLPLSYKGMRVYDALPGRVYSYLRLKPDSEIGGETMTFHVTLVDEQGRVVVDVEEFTLMQVRDTAASRLRGSGEEADSDEASESAPTVAEQDRRDLSDAILPEEGVEAFRRILFRSRLPQVAVVTRHLPTLIRQANEFNRDRVPDDIAGSGERVSQHPRPNLQTAYVAPRSEIEEQIAAVWQGLLGIDRVGIHDNFFDLGGDSVMGIQVVARMRGAGFQIGPEQLFQASTVARLADMLGHAVSQA
jgi:phthiocerol/phenolphthiocerol synthesis type-I polyketide synthase E